MPRWNAPKLKQSAGMAILVAATGVALTWLAHAPTPEHGARAPQPPAPPATAPTIDTPNLRPATGEPARPAAPPRGGNDPAAADPGLAGAEPAEPPPPARTIPLARARRTTRTP